MQLAKLSTALCTGLLIVACGTGTEAGGDMTAVMVRGVVTDDVGTPLAGVRVRASSFITGCDGAYRGEDAGVPQPVTEADGRYLLLLQSRAGPGLACVQVTATGLGTAADTLLQQVRFRDLIREPLDTLSVDLRLRP